MCSKVWLFTAMKWVYEIKPSIPTCKEVTPMAHSDVQTTLRLIDEKVGFDALDASHPPFRLDAPEPLGNDSGASPLQMFLESLSGCIGISVASLIRSRVRKRLDALEINTSGTLRTTYPKAFTHIRIHLDITSDATEEEVIRVLETTEEKLCPVAYMVRGNVDIQITHTLHPLD